MISTITQIVLPRPDTSPRRKRSPSTVIRSQNHRTNIKTEKTSRRKLPKLKPPSNILALPFLKQARSSTASLSTGHDRTKNERSPEQPFENRMQPYLRTQTRSPYYPRHT